MWSIFIPFLLPKPKWLRVLSALMSLGTLLLNCFTICEKDHFAWCQQAERISSHPQTLYLVQRVSAGGDLASQGTFSNIWRHFCITRVGGPLAYSGVLVSNASEHHTIHGSRHNKESSSQTATVPRPRSLATLLTHCMKCLVPVTRRSRINLRQNCDVCCLVASGSSW